MKTVLGVVAGFLLIGLVIWPGWLTGGRPFWDLGRPQPAPVVSYRDRVSDAVDDLKDDASEARIRDEIRDEVSDRREADRISNAIVDARNHGVSRRDISRAIDDVDDEDVGDLREIRRAIEEAKASTAAAPPTVTVTPPPTGQVPPGTSSAAPTPTSGGTAKFPTTAAEAAATFGGEASRWEPTADPGGWHLREEPFTTLLTPKGFLGEGYNDTKPGKNPDCYAFTVPIAVQGATIWSESGTKANAEALQKKMAIPVWDDGQQHACRVLAP